MTSKKDIARTLDKIGVYLELKGENPFKIRAYTNAARAIENLGEDLSALIEENRLNTIKGVGKALAEKIEILVKTGDLPYVRELEESIPAGLIRMLSVQGLGPRKVRVLHQKLGITTIGELEYACVENRLLPLKGFGEKSQKNILEGITHLKKYSEQHLLIEAEMVAGNQLDHIATLSGVRQCAVTGSIRRRRETVKDIDLTASCKPADRETIMNAFVEYNSGADVLVRGKTKTSLRLESGIQCDLRLVEDRAFPFALQHSTGSREHNTRLRSRAKALGLKMNEYGIFREQERVECRNETGIYQTLGLDFIPPELREDSGEIEAAESHSLPVLIEETDIRGMIHVHSTYSDGLNSIEELVHYCRGQGLEYLGLTDHSRSVTYAGGLLEDDVVRQQDEIDAINSRLTDFVVLKGIECDILPDGSLDYSEEFLERFDFIIASVHSSMRMPEDKMTERVIRAIRHPRVNILGHLTGRLLLAREPFAVDMERVIRECAQHRTAVEINASPQRLDLDWRWGRTVVENGVRISINPDAHAIDHFNFMKYGISTARKGWIAPEHVINTGGAVEFMTFCAKEKS